MPIIAAVTAGIMVLPLTYATPPPTRAGAMNAAGDTLYQTTILRP